MRYTLELSEEQAEIVKIALEEYFRLRMNQTWDFFGGEDTIILMAEYSTPEKAEKAMQKLHECYTGVLLMQNVSLPEEGAEQLKNMTTGFICINNREDNVKIEPMHTVFCFPQEDEI